jgi:pimeloyl-ACP methyl ester carboxylesterase
MSVTAAQEEVSMATALQAQLHHTTSRDGTTVGYWTSGDGPPLVLVHGGFGDHTRWDALRPHLEPHVTVHAMDRRGRGASGDHPDYSIEREYEDVAAVVDAVASETGATVDVYGVSLGGVCALGAALLTTHIRRLAVYEGWPPVPAETAPPPGFIERIEHLLKKGDREAALAVGYRELLQLSDDEIEHLKGRPEWSARLASVHTMPRELRTVHEVQFDAQRLAPISAPTLLLVGEEGPDWKPDPVAAALPDARIHVLEGQSHAADLFAPELVAKPLLRFLSEPA